MRPYLDPAFRQQLKLFTDQGSQRDRTARGRIQARDVRAAFSGPGRSDSPDRTRAQTIDEAVRELREWELDEDTRRQIQYANSKNNILEFLGEVGQPTRRDIAGELSQSLALFQPNNNTEAANLAENTNFGISHSNLNQEELGVPEPPRAPQPDISAEMLSLEPTEYVDAQIVPKNEAFVPYMYVLACFIDLRDSTLFGLHGPACTRVLQLALDTLQSQEFVDLLSLQMRPTSREDLPELVIHSKADDQVIRQLVLYFRSVYERRGPGERVLRRPSTYLQTLAGSDDALFHLFVAACFWKLGGNAIDVENGAPAFK